VPGSRLEGEGKKSENGGSGQEGKNCEEGGGQDSALPLWAAPSGFATHVKTVEVQFKELEFIDPSRMVRFSGVELDVAAGMATSPTVGLFTFTSAVDNMSNQDTFRAEIDLTMQQS
jgi:hypothetical protein